MGRERFHILVFLPMRRKPLAFLVLAGLLAASASPAMAQKKTTRAKPKAPPAKAKAASKPSPKAGAGKSSSSSKTFRHTSGMAFTYPNGWSIQEGDQGQVMIQPAGADKENELYVLAADSAEGVTRLDDPRVVPLLEAQIRQLFPQLERAGGPERFSTGFGPALGLTWDGTAPTGEPVRARTYVTLPGDGTALCLLALAEKTRFASREAALRSLFASLKREKPAQTAAARKEDDASPLARQWKLRLSGQKLTYLSSYNSGGAGGYSARTVILLGTDGRCSFYSNSLVSADAGGASGSSGGQNTFEGTWRIVTRGTTAVLELTPDGGGETREFTLSNQDGKTFLNDRRFFVTDP